MSVVVNSRRSSVQRKQARDGLHRLSDAFDNPSGDSVFNDLSDRSSAEGQDRRAACHGLDDDEAEGLRPIDRKTVALPRSLEIRSFGLR